MIDEILNHRSIRKYKNTPIEESVLDEILRAGCRASNTGNMQMYSIIVTTDIEIKEQLSSSHFNQPMVTQAAAVITFCADVHRFGRWCELRDAKPEYDNFAWFINGVIDTILASENVALQAEAHSLGVCYLGTTIYNADRIAHTLKLPKGVIPVTTLIVGYPEDGEVPLTDRLPLEAVVHRQTYCDYSDEKINELWSEREKSDETAELLQINDLPNLARIFTERRYKGEDNKLFSRKYFEMVKKQGFFNQ